ncbi:hypothetical protein GOP47_0007795 [Adiantum capillus-veneris]|uniref:Pentatricopeptide repeat-containing protein n=1 Tax=Adiantum capillus-veneris TaxID=13818 RepID=A0A9D4V1E6_ADICA|nr:hypothetical protein GOP47_0007795 [Adiantum capillus-veneris]
MRPVSSSQEQNKQDMERAEETAMDVVAVLKSCGKTKDLHRGIRAHASLLKRALLERRSYVATALLIMYVKCGALHEAEVLLTEFAVARSIVSWTVLIGGYAQASGATSRMSALLWRTALAYSNPNTLKLECSDLLSPMVSMLHEELWLKPDRGYREQCIGPLKHQNQHRWRAELNARLPIIRRHFNCSNSIRCSNLLNLFKSLMRPLLREWRYCGLQQPDSLLYNSSTMEAQQLPLNVTACLQIFE